MRLEEQIGSELSKLKSKTEGEIYSKADMSTSDSFFIANDTIRDLPEQNIIKRKLNKLKTKSLVGDKKINKPINKITTMKPEIEEKWSEKYKKSIDCNNPKGFSQKAHCLGKKKKNVEEDQKITAKQQFIKDLQSDPDFQEMKKKSNIYNDNGKVVASYRTPNVAIEDPFIKKYKYERPGKSKKEENKESTGASSAGQFSGPLFSKPEKEKKEFKEATGAASSGQYSTPAAWAKTMNKKDWRGVSKTQIPGGKFVQVKKKCKTFPYCNQGDIKSLKIFENETIKRIISEISREKNIDENVIKTILSYEYENK